MASFLIHMCVCDEINKVIKKNRKKILIGSIAPDIAKLVGIDRNVTHFGEYPNFDIELFLSKYKEHLNDDFVIGYFIHLYTDYLWDKYFINRIYKDGILTMVDGTEIEFDGDICNYLYQDYDSLIDELIDTYKIDLSFLKENIEEIPDIIKEIPIDKIKIVVDKTYELVNKNNKKSLNVMSIDTIKEFVLLCKEKTIDKISDII